MQAIAKEQLSEGETIMAFVSVSERKAWNQEENPAKQITYHHIARTDELETLCADLPEMIIIQSTDLTNPKAYFEKIQQKLNKLSDQYTYNKIENMKTENGSIGLWIRSSK